MTAAAQPTALTGIRGWLALLAVALCLSLASDSLEFFTGFLPALIEEWQHPVMRVPEAIILAVYVACLAVNVWALIVLFQKKKVLRRVYGLLWALSAAFQLSGLLLLTVPGVTIETLFASMSDRDIVRSVAEQIRYALWFWYLSVSLRVRNTMVN